MVQTGLGKSTPETVRSGRIHQVRVSGYMLNSGDCVFRLRTRNRHAGYQSAEKVRSVSEAEVPLQEQQKIPYNSQSFQRGLNVGELEKDGFVGYSLVIQDETDAPDCWREADVLGAG